VLGGPGLLQFAQLLRPLGGDVLRRLHAFLFKLGRRTGPIAKPADVTAVGEKEQGKDSQPQEGRKPREGADSFDGVEQSCGRLLVQDDLGGVSAWGGDQIYDPLRQISLIPGQNQRFQRGERRLDPIGLERRRAYRPVDPFRRGRLGPSRSR